jgi:hypothetical protein
MEIRNGQRGSAERLSREAPIEEKEGVQFCFGRIWLLRFSG